MIHTIDQHFAKIQPGRYPPLNEEWEIDAETYHYALEVLPPIYGKEGTQVFFMSEFQSGSVTTRYRFDNGRYFCALVDAATDPAFPVPVRHTPAGIILEGYY